MAKSIFEILVDTNYSTIQSGEQPFTGLLNQDLTTFVIPTYYTALYGQFIPYNWNSSGFSAVPQDDAGTSVPIFNSLFDEGFTNVTSLDYLTAHSSFYEPVGWSVTMHSIANNGLTLDGNHLSEDDSTNGYTYYNGNNGEIIPELDFRSRISGSSDLAERIGAEDTLDNLPTPYNDVSLLNDALNVDDQAYTQLPTQMYEFGSYRTLNIFSTDTSISSVYKHSSGGLFYLSKEAVAASLAIGFGYDTTDTLISGTELGQDSMYDGKYTNHNKPYNSTTGKSFFAAHQPTALRLENVFNESQEGSYVSVELEINNTFPYDANQFLLGSYVNGSANEFTSTALDFNVDVSSGTFTNSSFLIGAFRPLFVYNLGGGSYSDMTEEVSISSGRLRMKQTTNTPIAIQADVDLIPAQAYNFSCYISTTDHSSINVSVTPRGTTTQTTHFAEGEGDYISHIEDIEGGQRVHFSFNTSSLLVDGAKQEYTINIVTDGGTIGSVTELNYIRFDKKSLPYVYERQYTSSYVFEEPYTDFTQVSVYTDSQLPSNSDLIVTSSNVDDEYLRGQIKEGSAVTTLNYEDTNTSLSSLISKRILSTFFNPTTGEPMFLESETGRFNALNELEVDDDGQLLGASPRTVSFNLKIGSPHLNIFFDTISSNRIVDAAVKITNIKFLTSEDSYISRDDAGGDKIELMYRPALTSLAPPYIESNTVIDDLNASTEKVLSWDVSSLTGDPLMIDFGDNSTATEISSAGTGTATIIPNGNKLRIRVQSEAEKGTPLTGTAAVINSVSLGNTASITVVKSEPYGSELSINSTLPHIGAYDQALRVYSYEHATGNLINDTGGQSFTQTFTVEAIHSFLYEASQLYDSVSSSLVLKVNVLYIGVNNEIQITEQLGSNPVTTSITSTGTTVITRTGRNFTLSPTTDIIIKLISDGTAPLDIIIGSISLVNEVTQAEAGSQISLDLGDEVDVLLNFSIKDFSEIDKTSGGFSKTLKIPATSKNKKALNFKNELNSLNQEIDNQGVNCIIKADGLEVVKGNMFLTESELDEHGFQSLLLNVKSGNSDWADLISDVNLRDISLSSDYVDITTTNVQTYNLDAANSGIVFPLVDNGRWEVSSSELEDLDATFVGWSNLKAAFSIRDVLERILSSQNITIQSEFLNANGEWDTDFSSEFNGFPSKVYGLCPAMKRHEDDIVNSTFVATRSQQESTQYSNWHYLTDASYFSSGNDQRPLINSKILGEGWVYTADWCYTKLSEVIEIGTTSHLYGGISGSLSTSYVPSGAGGNVTTSAGYPTTSKTQNPDASANDYSSITVAKDGFYEVNCQAAVNFEIWKLYGFNNDFENSGKYAPNPRSHFFTSMLVAENDTIENITNDDSGSWGANLFDLEDESTQELDRDLFEEGVQSQNISLGNGVYAKKNYLNNTRITLSRIQFLKAGIKYNIVSVFGCYANAAKASNRKVYTNSKFGLKEFDIEIKLSESIHPMNGKENIVYNNLVVPKVSYREILPNISCLEFVSEITKLFNLVWDYNPYTSVLSVEPYGEFYDFNANDNNYIDWSDKTLITKIKEDAVAGSGFEFKMNEDSSDASVSQVAGSLPLGDKVIRGGSISEKKPKEMKLDVFSSCRMGYDNHIKRTDGSNGGILFDSLRLPRVHSKDSSTLEANINEEKPEANNSHEYKILYKVATSLADVLSMPTQQYKVHYGLKKDWVQDDSSAQYDGEFRAIIEPVNFNAEFFSYDLIEGSPNLTFSDQVAGTSLFTSYHKKLFDMVNFRDKMITAEVYLTTYDILNLDFSKLIRINDEIYLINKIKDFNFSGETTEVELLLVTIIE